MKKFALIIVLTVSLGLAGAIMVDEASAFGFFGRGWGGGYGGCCYGAPYYYGLMPYWGYGCGYGYGYPGYWGCKKFKRFKK
ncbi:MAG: hypothetical protein ACLQPD_20405 [Desulfomonilaceae bacterium]